MRDHQDAERHRLARADQVLSTLVIARTGPLPTLIEWDDDVPDWPTLRAEAIAAEQILAGAARASAA
jgi:uncharacterized protein